MSIFKKKNNKYKRQSQKRKGFLHLPSFKKDKSKSRSKPKHHRPNMPIIYLTIGFCIAGLLMIFSASAVNAYNLHEDPFYFFKRQIVWIILGIIAGGFFYLIPLSLIRKLSVPLLAFGILMLVIMLPEALGGVKVVDNICIPRIDLPIVATRNCATRWIALGSFDLQPAEFIKFSFIIYVSAWLTRSNSFSAIKKQANKEYFKNVVLTFLALLGTISLLILAQKDLDTTVIIVLTVLSIYYVAGNDFSHTLSAISILVSSFVFGLFAILMESYRRSRVSTFLDIFFKGEPSDADKLDQSFQSWNGIVAIGYGGLWGRGYGESRLKLGFLQEAAYTDSIYAVIGEEFGFIGTVLVILGFLYFTSLGMNVAKKAPDKFSALLATGMTSWISVQAFLNIAANLQIIPFGGMPLPFFSYGGSSTITILMAIGVILNVSKHGKAEVKSMR